MTGGELAPKRALLCFDGSADATAAIAVASELLDLRERKMLRGIKERAERCASEAGAAAHS
jgi:phage gp46-like protein